MMPLPDALESVAEKWQRLTELELDLQQMRARVEKAVMRV